MNRAELDKILDNHRLWLATRFTDDVKGERANFSYANFSGADLRGANLRGADMDFSCLPLWCGSLKTHFDDKQVVQFLYHTLSVVSYSKNVSEDLKKQLLSKDLVDVANQFHRVGECPEVEVYKGKVIENETI